MIDLKLDKITHDIDISTNDIEIINDYNYLEQKIKVELLFFFAEWFLDTTIGIKFWETVFIDNPNLTLVDNLFKTSLLEINGVNELLSYDSEYDSTTRNFTLNFSLQTDVGIITMTQGLTP